MPTKTALPVLATLISFALPARAQTIVTSPFVTVPIGRAGDVNADGRDDLLVQVGSNFQVLDGATNASIPHLQRTTLGPFGLTNRYTAIGDFDGDGKDDLFLWISDFSFNGNYTVVSGASGATLLTVIGPVVAAGGADFDGDGRSDLLLAANQALRVQSARTGATLFQLVSPPQTTTSPIYNGIAPAGDEDGDGREDVLAQYTTYITVGVTFMDLVRAPGVVQSIVNPRPVGDVDGDGRADYFCTNAIVAGGSQTNVWSLPSIDQCLRLGDLDGDGNDDVALGSGSGSAWTYVTASGATHATLPGAAPTTAPLWLGDLDGDGRSEGVVGAARYEWSDPSMPVSSRMLRRGTPGTTSDGRRPKLVTRGHCGLGRTIHFDMRGVLPNGLALLMFGDALDVDLASVGAPDNRCYTSLAGGLAFVANGSGVAQYQATMPVSPSLLGASLSLQSIVVDAAANALGLVTSNAADITTNN